MATYYIDKTATGSTNVGTQANPFTGFTRANDPTYVPSGADHTINVVAGTGPYYPSDAQRLSVGYIYPTQNNAANTITWNFNSNWFQNDFNVNTASYSWVKSTAVGKTTWYYLQAAGGGQPQRPATHTAAAIGTVRSCVIGDHIDGDWNDESTNLVNGAVSYKANNWAWGDYDSLGYSTLYVHLSGDANPAATGVPIWVVNGTYIFRPTHGLVKNIVNDAIFTGCNDTTIGPVVFDQYAGLNRCVIGNCRIAGVYISHTDAANSYINLCKFIGTGHRSISCAVQVDYSIYNSFFKWGHLLIFDNSNTAHTITLVNNSSDRLYAGVIQASGDPTIVESNNQFHIDPLSTHATKALNYAGTANWATTASSDFPASTATTDSSGTSPQVIGGGSKVGKPLGGSVLIGHGTATGAPLTDFDGVAWKTVPATGNPLTADDGATVLTADDGTTQLTADDGGSSSTLVNIGPYASFSSGGGVGLGLGLSGANYPHRRR